MSTSTRVIKNTTYLYIKMGVNMFVQLYTTRLILSSLGASDFGIFNVVGGAIAMLGFLNSTLANATQRFMSYAEGEGKVEKKRSIFNVSIVLHLIIAVCTVVLLLLAMYPLFNGVFNIEPERIYAAKIVYICLIISSVLTIINVPYDAIMNAHENMLYYSIVGIFESILKLGVAFYCVYTTNDKLIAYGVLMTVIPVITLSIMKFYCHRNYNECVIAPRKYWDGSLVKQISSFFGWNFLTAISSLFSSQGIGIVLNHFFGSILNAAQGVANQVNGALSVFSGNMMKALNPVIVKNAGSGNIESMNRVTIAGCKFSTLLTLVFGVPLSIEINYVLGVWLENVPNWAATFVVLQMIQSIITQMATSASTAVYAQGDIKAYAIWKSIVNVMPLFITWIAFRMGGGPIWLYIPMIVVWAIGGDLVIIYYASIKCDLKIWEYIYKVVLPVAGAALLMVALGLASFFSFQTGLARIINTCVATTIGLIVASLLFALTREEKGMIKGFALKLFHKK